MEVTPEFLKELVHLAGEAGARIFDAKASRLFSIDEAADNLGMSRGSVYNNVKSGRLVATDVFGQTKFTLEAINNCKKQWKRGS